MKIFILDDERAIVQSLKHILQRENQRNKSIGSDATFYDVTTSSNPKEALTILQGTEQFDILLIDLKMPQIDGLTFLRRLMESNFTGTIIAMSASGLSDLALEAIQLGAADFLPKPFSPEELFFIIKKNSRTKEAAHTALPHNDSRPVGNFSGIISSDPKMQEIFETISKISNFNTTALITGESGTGKELIARAIHQNSPRRNKKFIAINCAAIPETLLETELFGHKKGSFTDAKNDKKGLFEEAHGGTIFLDEIGDLPFLLQVKLLRVLQERMITPIGSTEQIPIDVRIITATLKDLETEVADGNFREDLLYRLNVIQIKIPPLRERRGDINLLIDHFLEKNSKKFGISKPAVDDNVREALVNYSWRGNIRELENCIERAVILKEGDTISIDSLPNKVLNHTPLAQQITVESTGSFAPVKSNDEGFVLSIKKRTTDIERELILKALEQTDGNRTKAAKLLEISHRALLYKIKEYEI